MSLQISYKKQFVLGLLLLIILFLSVESILRVYEYVTVSCGIIDNPAFSNLNYFAIKNICYSENTTVHGKGPLYIPFPYQYKFTLSINSEGFRGEEINMNNKYLIFLTGGSTAFGFGATSDETTISGFLQDFFDKDFGKENIEIVNAGINGADSSREILLIQEKLLKYKPDMIISYTGINDSGGYAKEIIFNGTYNDDSPDFLKLGSYPGFLRSPFVIFNFIKSDIGTEKNKIDSFSNEEILKNSALFMSNWNYSCETLKNNNITSVIILQPNLTTKKIPSEFEKTISLTKTTKQMYDKFTENVNSLKSKCDYAYDLSTALDYTNDTTYYDAGHTNDLGNNIIAQKIYEKISPIVKTKISNQ